MTEYFLVPLKSAFLVDLQRLLQSHSAISIQASPFVFEKQDFLAQVVFFRSQVSTHSRVSPRFYFSGVLIY
jgi:hypothetical protein